MELGSAVNCATAGAAGGGGAGAGAGGGGGGGGGAGTFFLQPAANIASETARQMTVNLPFAEHEHRLLKSSTISPTRVSDYYPAVVSCCNCVPSASMVQIWDRPRARRHEHDVLPIRRPTRILVPPLAVRQLRVLARLATSMMKMLKLPVAKPRVQANARICPSGCHDGLEASPVPSESRSTSAAVHIHPVNLLRDRNGPMTNAISAPVLGFTLGSTSMDLDDGDRAASRFHPNSRCRSGSSRPSRRRENNLLSIGRERRRRRHRRAPLVVKPQIPDRIHRKHKYTRIAAHAASECDLTCRPAKPPDKSESALKCVICFWFFPSGSITQISL